MEKVLLYESRAEFSRFMLTHLRQSMNVPIRQDWLDPLILHVDVSGSVEGRSTIQLHNAYEEYRYYGDMNAAVHFLNKLTSAYKYGSSLRNTPTVQLDKLIPVLRSAEYVEELVQGGHEVLQFDSYPGLRTVLLEEQDGYSVVVNREMLKMMPRLTAEQLLERAIGNLRRKGWRNPTAMMLKDESCGGLLFDQGSSTNYQFMLDDEVRVNLPPSYCIAFPNKDMTMVFLFSRQELTDEDARTEVNRLELHKVVKASFRTKPFPISKTIYWVNNGSAIPFDR